MAIPFNLPTQQEAEDNYQILDQLFEQLYEIVRQIILRQRRRRTVNRPPTPAPRNRGDRPPQRRENDDGSGDEGGTAEPSVDQNQQQAMNNDAMLRVLPLPDLVLSTNTGAAPSPNCAVVEAPIPPPRRLSHADGVGERPQPPPRRPRRRRRTCCCTGEKAPGDATDQRTRDNWQHVGKELRKIADEFRAASPLQDEGTQTSPDLLNIKKEESLLSLLVPAPFSGSVWTAVIFLVGWRFLASRGW